VAKANTLTAITPAGAMAKLKTAAKLDCQIGRIKTSYLSNIAVSTARVSPMR
jgi:hypothetical protein